MAKKIAHGIALSSLLMLSSLKLLASEVLVSNPGTGPDIYVSWNGLGPDPVLNDDFTISFTDSANPDIELQTGNVTWNIRSQDGSNPGNIGTISLNPNSSTASFDLTINNGSNAGAANVGSIALTAGSWTGHSSVATGHITGNLTGPLTVIKDSNGDSV